MSVPNPEHLATKQDLKDFYDKIRPYMGGLVTSKAGFTPIGTIISVMGTTAPVNYLACDGTVYNIADYTELANYFNEQFGSTNFFGGNGTTTFAVPDLRGEFLRGTGTNSHTNQGNGADVGTHQDATVIPHFQSNVKDSATNNLYFGTDANTRGILNADKNVMSADGGYADYSFNRDSQINRTGSQAVQHTTRPTNTSVLYCIATKNFYIDPTLDYSTDEKVVGTWIDGSTIYQRTFTFTALTLASNTWVTSTILKGTINNIISCEAKNEIASVDYITAGLSNNIDYIRFLSTRPTESAIDCVTLRYTKTT